MRSFLLALAGILLCCSANAQTGFGLAPGERLVAVDGVPVAGCSTCITVNGCTTCTNNTPLRSALRAVAQVATPLKAVAVTAPVKVEVPTITTSTQSLYVVDSDDVSSHHERTLALVKRVIDSSDRSQLQKNRLLRRLDRPWIAVRVTDEITSRGMAMGLISVSFDAVTGQATTNVDWQELIKFIEALLPLIIQIIGLFG